MKTRFFPGYHHNGFVTTHALSTLANICYTYLAFVRFEHSVRRGSLMVTYAYTYIHIYIYVYMYMHMYVYISLYGDPMNFKKEKIPALAFKVFIGQIRNS